MAEQPATRSRRIETILVAAAWAIAGAMFVWQGLWFPLESPSADYGKHWEASVAILQGRSPYLGEELYMGFNYPMITGFLFLHLAAFTRETGQTVWEIGNFVFSIAGTAVLAWGLRPAGTPPSHTQGAPPLARAVREFLRRRWGLCVFVLMAFYQPLHRVWVASNMEPLNLLIGGLFVVLFVRRKDTAAGMVLTLFALTKLAPILILIPVVALRRWRVVASCLGSLAVYALFLLATGYWRTEMILYTDIAPRLAHYYIGISCSIHRFAAQLLAPRLLEDEAAFTRFVFWMNAAMMPLYLAAVALWMRLRRRDPLMMLSWGSFMVLIFTPLLEVNHFVWVAGAILLQLRAWRDGRMRDGVFALCAIGWGLVLNMEFLIEQMLAIDSPFPIFYPQSIAMLFMVAASGVAAFRTLPEGAPDDEGGASAEHPGVAA